MIVLDTNVLSEFMIHTPDVRVVNWLNSQPRSSVWTASSVSMRFALVC